MQFEKSKQCGPNDFRDLGRGMDAWPQAEAPLISPGRSFGFSGISAFLTYTRARATDPLSLLSLQLQSTVHLVAK